MVLRMASDTAFRSVIRMGDRFVPGQRKQSGQALIYGLFVMTGGLAALFFLFNTGQLSGEKSKLVNTADAVAYSAGVMHARTLNYLAYTNRAMLANTVAFAQLVSLASWRNYADSAAMLSAQLGNPLKYPSYFPSYMALSGRVEGGLPEPDELQYLARAADEAVGALQTAQRIASLGMPAARQQVMDEVASANYRNGQDGFVRTDSLSAEADPFRLFVEEYGGSERGRFAGLASTAAKLDTFQDARSWRLDAILPNCKGAIALGRTDWIERRGGTELLGFDEWKAIDTISEHVWRPRNKWDVFCRRKVEHIAGFGGQSGADAPSVDPDPRHYDRSLVHNKIGTPFAMMTASSSSWGYSGIPTFFDLSRNELASADPSLLFTARVRRAISETSTSEGRSRVAVTPRLNNHRSATPSNVLVAVSTSKVYFRRPPSSCNERSYASRTNCRGADEIGSLFNPYWQVGLVQDGAAATARAMLGVALP